MSRGAGRLMPPGGADPPLDGQTPVYEPTGADPRVAPGLDRPPGSIARFGVSTYLQKTGTAATAWGTWAAGVGIIAGTQTANTGTVNFANSNGITFGMSNSSQITASDDALRFLVISKLATTAVLATSSGSITISIGGGIGVSTAGGGNVINLQNEGLTGLTVRQGTGTTGTTGGLQFGLFGSANGGISWGVSTDPGGATVTANPFSISYLVNNGYDRGVFIGDVSNGTIHVAPLHAKNPIAATRADQIMHVSNSASAGATITMRLGLYTLSGSTASQASSTSRAWSYNSTMASSSYTQVSGTRYRSMALGTWNITPGDYMMAMQWSVATALTSGTHQPHGGRDVSIDADEYVLGLGSRARYWNGGFFTVTSNALPASFHLTDIGQSGSNDVIFVPFVTFAGTF